MGGGAVSSARSCAAEARRQWLSELGRDGSAVRSRRRAWARNAVGELGAELGGGAVSSARQSPLKKVTFKTMTCGSYLV